MYRTVALLFRNTKAWRGISTSVGRMLILTLVVCAASAQLPRIGDIYFYGLHKTTPKQILDAANLAPGDTLPESRGDLEDKITDLPDVTAAQVQTFCCEGNRVTLFIGIEERGERAPEFRLPPSDAPVDLPADLMTRYNAYEGELLRLQMNAAAAGAPAAPGVQAAQDRAMHGYERQFQSFAAAHLPLLQTVLRGSSDADDRAAAATVMGSAPNKKAVVDDLIFALQDSDPTVRTNAMRSLAAIAPSIPIPPERFVDLLNSVVLSDRMESVKALLVLTASPNPAVDLIRQQALGSLAEMARWKTPGYAMPPFRLLGRVAGLPDAQVRQMWAAGDREQVIQKALDSAAKKQGQ
jgi:HEAT repeats